MHSKPVGFLHANAQCSKATEAIEHNAPKASGKHRAF